MHADLFELLENSHTTVIALDKMLTLQYLNASAETLLDLSKQRALGAPMTEVIGQKELYHDLHRAIEQHQQFTRWETPLTFSQGTITADYFVTPMDCQRYSLLLEIHPRERLRRIASKESQATGHETSRNLVRGLAHEIKNPLGGIRGAAQLLSRMLKDPTLEDYTGIIIEEADRLRDLVDRMLGPLTPPYIRAINIHEVLERVGQLISAETNQQLRITRDYDPSIPPVPVDKELMIQALLNLSRNAMQAIMQTMSLEEGHLTLRSRITRQFTINRKRRRLVCHLSVIDNGPGVPESLSDSLFYPMISGHPEGSGLGLSVTQSIIRQHKGLIECDSRPGNTCFHVYLPLQDEQS